MTMSTVEDGWEDRIFVQKSGVQTQLFFPEIWVAPIKFVPCDWTLCAVGGFGWR